MRSQLAAREADVTRLERRVRELESPLGVSSKGGVSTTALSSSALCGGSGGSGISAAGMGSGGTALTAAALSGIFDEDPTSRADDTQDDTFVAATSSSRTVSQQVSRQVSPEPVRRQVAVPLVSLDCGSSRLGEEAPGAIVTAFSSGLPAFGAETVHFATCSRNGPLSRQAMHHSGMQLPAVQPLPGGLLAHPASSTTTPAAACGTSTGFAGGVGVAGPSRARTPPPQLMRVDASGFGVQRARSPPRLGPSLNTRPDNSDNSFVTRLVSAPTDGGTVTPPPPTNPHPASPSDGMSHTLQRSQSVPVQLLRGAGGCNQAPPNGVSLAQWAASPGGPSGSSRSLLGAPANQGVAGARGGIAAHPGSPQQLGGPPGAQVLGGGMGQTPPPVQVIATGPLGLAARRHS